MGETPTEPVVEVQISPALAHALAGQLGTAGKQIADVGLEVVDLLLKKNHDYGSSGLRRPVLAPGLPASAAILCRMSDTIERLGKLNGNSDDAQIAESYRDTMRDLAGYAVLWLVVDSERRARNQRVEEGKADE